MTYCPRCSGVGYGFELVPDELGRARIVCRRCHADVAPDELDPNAPVTVSL